MTEVQAFRFDDDGETPNNPRLPLLVYRAAFSLEREKDPAVPFERAFAAHGWGDGWRNGIYPFLHFHTDTHEVLGIARGCATVEFGGARGRTDVPKIVDWYMDGKIEIDPLITHTMPLEEINDAFDLMHEGKSIRSVVTF